MKTILAVDGNSILNRAFYGIRPLTTRDGKNTNAVFGMFNILYRQVEALRPDAVAVAFDLHAPTFRKERYPDYKAGRHPTPPELLEQFPYAKKLLTLLGMHVIEREGYEADDLLGTVSAMGSAVGAHTYILSGDRDLLQLISPSTTVLLAGNAETTTFKKETFVDKFGIIPEEYVDMKAIMGDASDNIPGVPGIGEKGAQKLISAFHSLDGIYEHIDDPSIPKGQREKLINSKESAYLSKFLARICTEAPMDESLEDLAYIGIPDRGALFSYLTEMEFSAMIRKLGLSEQDLAAADGKDAPCSEAFCPTDLSAAEIAVRLASQAVFAADIADGHFLFSAEDGEVLRCTDTAPEALAPLAPLFSAASTVITFDGKRLLHALEEHLLPTENMVPEDLLLMAYVVDPQTVPATAAEVVRSMLGTLPRTSEEALAFYPETRRLLLAKVEEAGATDLLYKIEFPLAPLLFRMERRGFKLDTEALLRYGKELRTEMAEVEERIYMLAGGDFNLNSPKQLGEILFVRLGLPAKKKTKSGYSTGAEVLEALRPYHPIIADILEYRQLSKLYSTYIVGLHKAVAPDGRLHTDFKQALTATGRLSSAEPNLQNIPIRTAAGRKLRNFFVAKNSDYVLIDADYSQIELRLLAHIAGDPVMTDAFLHGADIHSRTAAAVFGVPETAVPDELRKRAKAINFGIVYGIGGYSLSEDLGISVAEASRYIKAYKDTYHGIADYLDAVVARAKECGYTTTLFGRRRYIPELRGQTHMLREFGKRVAMNSPIQGTAADIMKIAMLRVDRRLRAEGLDAAIVMQVHDELILEAKSSVAELAAAILKEEMESAASLSVPLPVEISMGESWACKS